MMKNLSLPYYQEYPDVRVCIDRVDRQGIAGWGVYKREKKKRVRFHITLDGVSCGVCANAFREDLLTLKLSDGYSGFHYLFSPQCFDGKKHILDMKLAGSTVSLFNGPLTLFFPEQQSLPSVEGVFEHVASSFLFSGWAVSSTKTTPDLEILINGQVQKNCAVEWFVRPDIFIETGAEGKAGFRGILPEHGLEKLFNEIAVRAAGKELRGSPRYLDFSKQVSIALSGIEQGQLIVRAHGFPGSILSGTVFVDGRPTAALELTRDGATTSEYAHKGCWPLPEELRDAQQHVYHYVIREKERQLESDAVVLRYPDYRSNIDVADAFCIQGWVWRPDRTAPFTVGCYIGSACVARTTNNLMRQDVLDTYHLRSMPTGFVIRFDSPQKLPAVVTLKDEDTQIDFARIYIDIHVNNFFFVLNNAFPQKASLKSLYALSTTFLKGKSADTPFRVEKCPSQDPYPVSERGITVIVPIYESAVDTAECLMSVLEAQNKRNCSFIFVNDNTPNSVIQRFLNTLEKKNPPHVTLLKNTENKGFSRSINLGIIAAGRNDVILLNADTVVQDGWIDRLARAAESDASIGTVTPFSNNGEVAGFPYLCRAVPVPDKSIAARIQKKADENDIHVPVAIPVAVGFCMYIRRECLDDVGLFDADTWGRGYGEEVDFCLQASFLGWKHVLAPDVFVIHRGEASFGEEKKRRILESQEKIKERYPFYAQWIQDFINVDPLYRYRRKLSLALLKDVFSPCIVHLSHSLGGGTERYLRDLVATHLSQGKKVLIVRFDVQGNAVLECNLLGMPCHSFFSKTFCPRYTKEETAVLLQDVQGIAIQKVHIHSFIGMPRSFVDAVTSAYPYDITIHDYIWICPRATLTDQQGRYCGEPDPQQCKYCLRRDGFYQGYAFFEEGPEKYDIARYRNTMKQYIERAETVFTGSFDVVQRLEHYGYQGRFNVEDYPISQSITPYASPKSLETIRVAVIGAISEIKGYTQLRECARHAEKAHLPLQFIIVGYTCNDAELLQSKNIIITGKYEESELDGLIHRHQPHLSFFPNQWPETYSYTLSLSFAFGLFPVAADRGAIAERIRRKKFGAVYPVASTTESICNLLIEKAVQNPEEKSDEH